VEVGHTAAEFQSGGEALKQGCQLLHGWLLGIVVIGRRVSLTIFVDEFLGAGECQLFITGVYLAGEVMGLFGKLEDAGAGGIGECEIRLVIVTRVGINGNLARGFVVSVTIGLDCDRIALGTGSAAIVGATESRTNAASAGQSCKGRIRIPAVSTVRRSLTVMGQS
jgi:hypothetical protein